MGVSNLGKQTFGKIVENLNEFSSDSKGAIFFFFVTTKCAAPLPPPSNNTSHKTKGIIYKKENCRENVF
jgi:hypothetical protein